MYKAVDTYGAYTPNSALAGGINRQPKEDVMAGKNREVVVVASKIKEYVKSKGCQTAGDSIPALSEAVYDLLEKAIKRTKDNGRMTVKPQDL